MSDEQKAFNPPEALLKEKAPFDPRAAAAELTALSPNRAERKLSFHEQCAAFYCLYCRHPQKLVAQTFGVSMSTVSHIGGCLARDPNPWQSGLTLTRNDRIALTPVDRDINKNRSPNRIQRYRKVAEEFEALGEDEFARRYYTREIHSRLMKVKFDLDGERGRRARRGPDPDANKAEGIHTIPYIDGSGSEDVRIHWVDGKGWTFTALANGWTDPESYRTSGIALNEAWRNFGHEGKPES